MLDCRQGGPECSIGSGATRGGGWPEWHDKFPPAGGVCNHQCGAVQLHEWDAGGGVTCIEGECCSLVALTARLIGVCGVHAASCCDYCSAGAYVAAFGAWRLKGGNVAICRIPGPAPVDSPNVYLHFCASHHHMLSSGKSFAFGQSGSSNIE